MWCKAACVCFFVSPMGIVRGVSETCLLGRVFESSCCSYGCRQSVPCISCHVLAFPAANALICPLPPVVHSAVVDPKRVAFAPVSALSSVEGDFAPLRDLLPPGPSDRPVDCRSAS